MSGARNIALNAARGLNELAWQIIGGDAIAVAIENCYNKHGLRFQSADQQWSAQHVLLSNVTLALCKADELLDYCAKVMPADHADWRRQFRQEFKRRDVRKFRSKHVAHAIDDDTKHPMTPTATNQRFERAVDGDSERFFLWACNPQNHDDPETVLGRVRAIVKALMSAHGITEEELFEQTPAR